MKKSPTALLNEAGLKKRILPDTYFKPDLPAAADRFHSKEIIDRDGVVTGHRMTFLLSLKDGLRAAK
jgi:hypothetical protein